VWSIWWNENWQGKPKYSDKTCPSATLSTTNPTWLTGDRNRSAALGSRRLTAWAMARPNSIGKSINHLASQLSCMSVSRSINRSVGQLFRRLVNQSVGRYFGSSVSHVIITSKRRVVRDMKPRPTIYKSQTTFLCTAYLNTAIQASVCWQKMTQITIRRPPTSASRDRGMIKTLIPAPRTRRPESSTRCALKHSDRRVYVWYIPSVFPEAQNIFSHTRRAALNPELKDPKAPRLGPLSYFLRNKARLNDV
jgi:hypothetical protein